MRSSEYGCLRSDLFHSQKRDWRAIFSSPPQKGKRHETKWGSSSAQSQIRDAQKIRILRPGSPLNLSDSLSNPIRVAYSPKYQFLEVEVLPIRCDEYLGTLEVLNALKDFGITIPFAPWLSTTTSGGGFRGWFFQTSRSVASGHSERKFLWFKVPGTFIRCYPKHSGKHLVQSSSTESF